MKIPKELITVTPLSKIVALIVLAAVMIIGFALGITYQETIDLKKQNTTAQVTINKPTAQPIDKTANWKTYTSAKFKYSLKYPSDWSLKETPYGSYNGRTLFLPPSEIYDNPNAGSRGIATDFRDTSYASPLPASPSSQPDYQKIRTVYVESQEVDVLKPIFQNAAEKYFAKIRNGKYEYIFYFGRQLDGKYDSVFDQILSTFKFTDKDNQIVCTQDVKQCSDGSYVSRKPPSCEFAKCS